MSKIIVKKIKIRGKQEIECIYTSQYIHENRRKPEYIYFSVMHDDDGTPCSICLNTWINNCGTIILKKELVKIFEEVTHISEEPFYELSNEEINELYDNSNLFEIDESEIMLDESVLRNFKVEKDWMNGNFNCKIIKMPLGYRCGYVGVPKNNPFFKKKHFQLVEIEGVEIYFNYEIRTANTINYSDFTDNDDYWYFGFDCLNSNEKFGTFEYCMYECNSICQQIRALLLVLNLNGRKNS